MQMARIIGAAADLSERTSDVAVSALNVTSQLASEATHFVLQAAANGLSTGANLWKGVDLQDIQAHRCNGQVLVDGPESFEQWLNSSQALVLIPCLTDHLRQQLVAASQTLGLAMPMTQTAIEDMDIGGKFWSTRIWGMIHESGRLQITFDTVELSFIPLWSNPLWRGLPLGSEREQILDLTRQTLVSLPRPSVAPQPLILEVASATPLLRDHLAARFRGSMLYVVSGVSYFWSVILQSGGLFFWMVTLIPCSGFLYTCAILPFLVISGWWRGLIRCTTLRPFPVQCLALLDGRVSEVSPISVRSSSEISSEDDESYVKVAPSVMSSSNSSFSSFSFLSSKSAQSEGEVGST